MAGYTPNSFGALRAANALAGNNFYGQNNHIIFNGVEDPHQNRPLNRGRRAEAERTQIDEAERDECLSSFSFGSINARRNDIAPAHPGTCDWLFFTAQFGEWRSPTNIQEHNEVLWIKGKPGTGKSTLMKHALIHCQTHESFSGCICVAYFFNARGEALEKTPLGMLLSIVYQLLREDAEGILYQRILPSFREKKIIHRTGIWQWTQSELREFIRLAVTQSGPQPLLIFTDALDECVESDVRDVVTFLESLSILASRESRPLKICLSSRHYPSITMGRFQELIMEQSRYHHADIFEYLRRKLRVRDAGIMYEVLQRAEGIFLWVVIIVSLLNKAYDEGRVESMQQELQKAPRDLEDMFLTILGRTGPGNDAPIPSETILTLQWVLLSKRLLGSDELCAAVVGAVPNAESLIRRRIDTLSKGLVEVRESKQTQFIHLSVRDFLLRHRRLQTLDASLGPEPFQTSHARLWARCWTSVEKADLRDPFRRYAVIYILDHAENALDDTAIRDILINVGRGQHFTNVSDTPERTIIRHWLREWRQWFLWWWNQYHESSQLGEEPIATLPYILVLWGLSRLLGVVLDYFNPDSDIPLLSTGLQVASFQGQQEAVRLLLAHGASINMRGFYHIQMKDDRTTIDTTRIRYGSALEAASGRGNYNIARLLIENGADVNASDVHETSLSALQAATSIGHCELVTLLIDHGARIDAKDWNGEDALHRASLIGHPKVVRILIDRGADLNARSANGATALHLASRQGHDALVRLLVDKGADVNAPSGSSPTALQTASSRGNQATVRLLIDNGADVNAQNDYFGTALHAASSRGNQATVRLLIDNGADVNARHAYFGTALQSASKSGSHSVVLLLVANGADVNAPGINEIRGTALQLASFGGHRAVVRTLIAHGADVNARSINGDTALYLASRGQDDEIIRFLINNGATDYRVQTLMS